MAINQETHFYYQQDNQKTLNGKSLFFIKSENIKNNTIEHTT